MAQHPTSSTTASRARSAASSARSEIDSTVDSALDRGEGLMSSALDIARDYSDKARSFATDAGERAVVYVRRYPVNVAIGACVLGIVIGYMLAPRRRPRV